MEQEKKISTGLKVWLWIVLVLEAITLLRSFGSITSSPLATILEIVLRAVVIYGCIAMMFQFKKLGFKLIVLASVVNAIVGVITAIFYSATVGVAAGEAVGVNGAAVAVGASVISTVFIVIFAAIVPFVTWLFAKGQWEVFE